MCRASERLYETELLQESQEHFCCLEPKAESLVIIHVRGLTAAFEIL